MAKQKFYFLRFDQKSMCPKWVLNRYFHFNNEGSVTLNGNRVRYQGKKAEAVFSFLSDKTSIRKEKTHLSRRYNHEEDNETVTVSWSGEGFTSCITVIQVGTKGALCPMMCEKIPVHSVRKDIIRKIMTSIVIGMAKIGSL